MIFLQLELQSNEMFPHSLYLVHFRQTVKKNRCADLCTVKDASPLLFLAMQATSPESCRAAEHSNKAWQPCSLMITYNPTSSNPNSGLIYCYNFGMRAFTMLKICEYIQEHLITERLNLSADAYWGGRDLDLNNSKLSMSIGLVRGNLVPVVLSDEPASLVPEYFGVGPTRYAAGQPHLHSRTPHSQLRIRIVW